MVIGAVLTCDDGVCDDTVSEVGRTPIGCVGYVIFVGCGGWWGLARRIGR
jgi:hypothetical protein